jgi:Galactose oxidase, central domain
MIWIRLSVIAAFLMALPPQTPTQPGIRFGHALAYDSHGRRVVLVDGYTWVRAVSPIEPPERTDLWAWNGNEWSRLAGTGPASRTMNRAVYDIGRRTLVSFGGRVGRPETPNSDTWQWSSGSWQRIADAADGPNVHFEMAYDAARATTVRYGGAIRLAAGGFAWPTTTWGWDGRTWTTLATDGPVGRAASHMVFDSRRREIVLFGGQGAAPVAGQPQPVFGDTWLWNGRAWRQASVVGPPPRSFHAMTFDSGAGLVLLHGGMNGDRILDDLWGWDGTRWREMTQGASSPGKRRLHAIVFDEARNRTVLYGGVGPDASGATRGYDDTWEWNGRGWSRIR